MQPSRYLNALVLIVCSLLAIANAQDTRRTQRIDAPTSNPNAIRTNTTEEAKEARAQVNAATRVVEKMTRDAKLKRLLQNAKGILIIPLYGKAAVGIGGSGGEGVLLVHRNGTWSDPAFYNVGAVSVGAQAGAVVGAVAMLLMSDAAIARVKTDKNAFSLDAKAGITIVNYSADKQADTRNGDVIVWSDTNGVFAGVSVGISDINRDDDENRAYYSKTVTPVDIFNGAIANAKSNELSIALQNAG